ncbi:MAG: zinc-finger domain-containing protein [Alphaproteobacteria bacterium]|nr:zinc-finger domain-containing protein [Alphaproteobacteria bacterium]
MTSDDVKASAPAETKTATQTSVACDGGVLGHPRIFLKMGTAAHVDCPYCGCRFVLASDGASDATGEGT